MLLLFLGIMLNVIITRGIGIEARGIYALVMASSALLALFFGSGFSYSSTYIIGKDRNNLSKVVSNICIYLLITSVFLSIILLINPEIIKFIAGTETLYISIVIIILTLSLILKSYILAIFLGLENILAYNFVPTAVLVFTLIINAVALYIFNGTLKEVLIIQVISSIIMNIIGLTIIIIKEKCVFKPSFTIFKESLFVGSKSILSNVIGQLVLRSDIFLVNYFLGLEAVAYYSIAVSISLLILKIPSSASGILFSKVSNIVDKKKSYQLTSSVVRNLIPVSVISCIIFYFLGEQIITFLYGIKYNSAYHILVYLLPGVCLVSLLSIINSYLAGIGYPLIVIYAPIIALILNIILNIIMIPVLGSPGAAISSSIAYTVFFVITLRYFLKQNNIPLLEILITTKEERQMWKNLTLKFIPFK
jgi:O-antigen/teichoic acid export membrane protein